MASVAALSAAAQDRKARLAQLKNLKRKQAPSSDDPRHHDEDAPTSLPNDDSAPAEDDTSHYISGRNYDPETKGPRLGFESAPSEGQETLEVKAARLAAETKQQAEADAAADKPLDLFKLQPKKPNWDLKRDLDRKMEVLNVRTDNAIARIVRERIEKQRLAAKQQAAGANGNGAASGEQGGDAEAAGIEGSTLVEATNIREREDEDEARRELEEDEALLLDAS